MTARRILIGGIIVIAVVLAGWQAFILTNRDKYFDFYMNRLGAWVRSGGNIANVQTEIVETCGKLIMTQSNVPEIIGFLTYNQEKFHIRVDVCTKMTVHRVWPQPEFEDPKIVKIVCESSEFKVLCHRSGLIAPP